MKKTLIYLATPYTHIDADVMERRFKEVNKVAALMMKQGMHVFSPISHTHPIAIAGGLPRGWEYWEKYDRAILSVCCEVVVLCQDGWMESKGVKAEIEIANELNIPVRYMSYCGRD